MIRVDEIYNNTFWPWMQEHLGNKRVFYCDPPGHTGTSNLFNHGSDHVVESDYIFFHDQEPVHVDIYKPLFDDVVRRNKDIRPHAKGGVITSEYNSDAVTELCNIYGWRSYYYFYHGWASLDWYRGYNRTFLLPRARDRKPSTAFMSPNRIVGGHRDHRVLFMYNLLKNNLTNNHITCPEICPEENVNISTIANRYSNVYPDIVDTFNSAELPILFQGEDTQVMSSCWLTNFNEITNSIFYVPTETVYFGRRSHITEKTFKAIASEMPFVLVATAHSLDYLRKYGFLTFSGIIDESYDTEEDDIKRIEKVTALLKDINDLSAKEKQEIHNACVPIVEHNYNHFYNGGFEDILWAELTNMLQDIKYEYA